MNKIIVGKIVNTHGIRGEIKIQRTNDETFKRNINYFIEGYDHSFSVENAREDGQMTYLKLEGYNDVNDVLKFKTKYIYIDEDDLYNLSDDEYFIKDLIGMKVISQSGEDLGHLSDVLTNSANDVYVVRNENGEKYVPAVKEFIKKVDLKNAVITINLIEGM